MIETGESREIMNLDPFDVHGRLIGIWFQFFAVQAKGIVEFLQLGRNDALWGPLCFSSFEELGKQVLLRCCYEPMASHANACGRNARMGARLGAGMAIQAGYLPISSMLAMRECNRLCGFITLLVARQMIASDATDEKCAANDQSNKE
jgi:hypothetical protein